MHDEEDRAEREPVPAPGVDFFLHELAAIDLKHDRKYESLARRVAELQGGRGVVGSMFGDLEPYMLAFAGLYALAVIAPLIREIIKTWRSPSPSPL